MHTLDPHPLLTLITIASVLVSFCYGVIAIHSTRALTRAVCGVVCLLMLGGAGFTYIASMAV